MNAVWVVDDDESIRWVLERALTRQGYTVRSFDNVSDCERALADDTPRVLVSDIRMPGSSGLELLKRVRQSHPKLPVIIMTAYSDLDSAVSALQGGAFEYLAKPFDIDNAVDLIRRASAERGAPAIEPPAAAPGIEILGKAAAMQEVFRAIGRLSASNVTVLITGESGTGKELVARALHDHSPRARKVFVALNTAAIPRELLESELFGHERGSFTGAQQSRIGRFEQAEGGTLFLDEIGDMPAELQTRLLRVLSDGQFYRVGGHQPLRADVRVIAATHQDLEERVRRGLFREDLYHRLHVIRLRVPALRERIEDIPLLARHFLHKSARELGGEPKRLSDSALAVMRGFHWPGNVRQLENVCRWLTVMAATQVIGESDLPPELKRQGHAPLDVPAAGARHDVDSAGPSLDAAGAAAPAGLPEPAGPIGETAPAWAELLEREVSVRLARQSREQRAGEDGDLMDQLTRVFEATVIGTTLRHTRGRRIDAAHRLGIGRNTITRKIQDLRLETGE